MRKQRLAAARSVAESLFAFEQALDRTFALGAGLSSGIVNARMDAGISAVIGQDAIDGAIKTLALIADARRELVSTHHQLKAFADNIGLREVSWGDLVKPPAAQTQHEQHLRVAA
jgi:hypothetical protein